MRSTFFGLEIGRTGLNVSQKGLDVTGHNIANVDTIGYTRQRLITTAYDPYAYTMRFRMADVGAVGGGAHVKILDQIRSSFLDRQYRTQQTAYSYWATRVNGLTYTQNIFEGKESIPLGNQIIDLFSSFNLLATEADDAFQRATVRNASIALCDGFHQLYEQLSEQQQEQNLSVYANVMRINSIAENITELNKAIYRYEYMGGQPANDLRDKRNLLLDELSSLVNIQYGYHEDPDDTLNLGKLWIKIDGEYLVDYKNFNQLECVEVAGGGVLTDNDRYDIYWMDPDPAIPYHNPNQGIPMTGTGSGGVYNNGGSSLDALALGGELMSHMVLRDSVEYSPDNPAGIPYFIKLLNDLAKALVQSVNEIHREGWTQEVDDGMGGKISLTGVNFFEFMTFNPDGTVDNYDNLIYSSYSSAVPDNLDMVTAKNISINSDIFSDPIRGLAYIAASTKQIILTAPDYPTQGDDYLQEGNQINAQRLYELINRRDIPIAGGESSLFGFFESIIFELASIKKQSDDYESLHRVNLLGVDTQRESLSGVSLDEEMTNMIRYSHAYNGAARIITAMDEALDVLINRMGRVGL
ncbi:MAG: flagellar hook-associated protein FlgK [Oscillospiraceae bacterium]|nr:flagellar hook-associated protein FlgK [Oscillospiraceae bacterium]